MAEADETDSDDLLETLALTKEASGPDSQEERLDRFLVRGLEARDA